MYTQEKLHWRNIESQLLLPQFRNVGWEVYIWNTKGRQERLLVVTAILTSSFVVFVNLITYSSNCSCLWTSKQMKFLMKLQNPVSRAVSVNTSVSFFCLVICSMMVCCSLVHSHLMLLEWYLARNQQETMFKDPNRNGYICRLVEVLKEPRNRGTRFLQFIEKRFVIGFHIRCRNVFVISVTITEVVLSSHL